MYVLEWIENRYSDTCTYMNVHRNTIHKSKFTKPQATQISIKHNVYLKKNVVYPYHTILFSHRNEVPIHSTT